MPRLSVGVPHQLGREEATDRLKARFDEVKAQFGDQVTDLNEQWNDHAVAFQFKTFGLQVKGDVTSAEEEVLVNADLPMAALMFKGKIETQIREQLSKILA